MKDRRLLWLTRLELRAALGPEALMPVLALLLVAVMKMASPTRGPESWSALFTENVESFVAIAIALAMVPLLLREMEHRVLEEGITSRPQFVGLMRFVLFFGGFWGLSILWLGLLDLFWGPVAFAQGLYAGLGPSLLLSGVGTYGALRTGRSSVGYLLGIGWALADLILRLLGALAGPLQIINVFAYRWPAPGISWQEVAAVQGLVGLAVWGHLLHHLQDLWKRLL